MAKQEGYQSIGMLKPPFFLRKSNKYCMLIFIKFSRYHTNKGNLASHNNNLTKHTYISDIFKNPRRNKTDSLYALVC